MNFLANLSPDFLCLTPYKYNNLSIARLLPIEILFFYPGLFAMRSVIPARSRWFLPYAYLFGSIAMVPAMLAADNPHAMRASALMIFTPLFSAAGVSVLASQLRSDASRFYSHAIMIVLTIASSVVLISHYIQTPDLRNANQQNELVTMSSAVGEISAEYDEVLIQDTGNQLYLYVTSFTGMTPTEFMNAEKRYISGDWYHFKSMGKYRFLEPVEIKNVLTSSYGKDRKILAVSREAIPGLPIIKQAGGFLFMRRPE